MKTVLIGANGLVGSAFGRYFNARGLAFKPITRAEMNDVAGLECDLMISCIGNANKGRANADPAFDFIESVSSVSHYIHAIKAQRVIHISTVDVYDQPADREKTGEDRLPVLGALQPYGFHKYMAENVVRRFAHSWQILRLPGLVGPGLTKNPVFDHFSPGKKLFVNGSSRLNFIHVDDVASLAMTLLDSERGNITLNVAARDSIQIDQLPEITGLDQAFEEVATENIQTYEINTDRAAAYMKLPSSSEAVLRYQQDLNRTESN